MPELRDYQARAISMLYDWMRANDGNPCLQMPTGSGKSHVVAELCRDAIQSWPETRILMLTHVKELIEQNARKLRQHWLNAPLGIYSAGLRRKELGEPITFGGIQSLRKRASDIGHIDLVIIDECHLVSHKDEGGYRQLLADLAETNPRLRVIGLTATPYRLGHGLITDAPAIFSTILEPVTIEELIAKGHLATLRSKHTDLGLDITGVRKRGGEFIESQLQAAVDTEQQVRAAVEEIVKRAEGRSHWLAFCAGVAHAEHVRDSLREHGVTAETVTGTTPRAERDDILARFKRGEVTAVTNANVLTTGFDYPDIDLVAMLRPTMSPSLYVQMAGRGMRPKSHTDHCLVLDFAGVVETHGPITCVRPPDPSGGGSGEAPTKTCPACGEICHAAVRRCPSCNAEFPPPEREEARLRNDDIMGSARREMPVKYWQWHIHRSYNSGKLMLRVSYHEGDVSKPVVEYLTVTHEGYAGDRAKRLLASIAMRSGAPLDWAEYEIDEHALGGIVETMRKATPPESIEYEMDGKFAQIKQRRWSRQTEMIDHETIGATSGAGMA